LNLAATEKPLTTIIGIHSRPPTKVALQLGIDLYELVGYGPLDHALQDGYSD